MYVGVRVLPSASAGPRPPPPALKWAGKWEGVGVWPDGTPPPPPPVHVDGRTQSRGGLC